MKLKDTMIAWNPLHTRKPDQPWVKCGPHPVSYPDWTDPYLCTDGACWVAWRKLVAAERLDHLFGLFGCLIVRDKVPADQVHEALMEVDEYRAMVRRYNERWEQAPRARSWRIENAGGP